jgi:hypothetical protein
MNRAVILKSGLSIFKINLNQVRGGGAENLDRCDFGMPQLSVNTEPGACHQ